MRGWTGGNGAAAPTPSRPRKPDHGFGLKISFLPTAVLSPGDSAVRIDASWPRVPGVTARRALGFSAVCKLHAMNFSGAAAGRATGCRGCRRGGFLFPCRGGRGWAGLPPPEDNEPLLEAAVSLPLGAMSPKMWWAVAASSRDSSEGCSSQPWDRSRCPRRPAVGSQPGTVLGCTSTAALTSFPGAWDAPGCSWMLRVCSAPQLHPKPTKSPPTKGLCRVPQSTKPGTVSAGAGDTWWVPTCCQAACQLVPPASALAESPARYSPHKGPILLRFRRAGVTGSNPAAPGAPTLKPGPKIPIAVSLFPSSA